MRRVIFGCLFVIWMGACMVGCGGNDGGGVGSGDSVSDGSSTGDFNSGPAPESPTATSSGDELPTPAAGYDP